MRYYRIEITEADGADFAIYTNKVNGENDPGALMVELDIIAAMYATPVGGSFVRIWGIPITVISQAKDFNGKRIKVYGGMQKGLPLAMPDQAGLLAQGTIVQGFGNWIGANMSLDLIMIADTGTPDAPKNIALDWKKNTPLSDALKSTLATAFPDLTVTVDVSDNLIQDRDEAAFYETLDQLASWVLSKSKSIIRDPEYRGVQIALSGGDTVRAYDGNTPQTTTEISFNDLIGQPTWIDPATIQLTLVMRADLSVLDAIKLPKTQVTTTPQSQSQYRDDSIFQGSFGISMVRHVGNSRTPDATSWITVVNAYPIPDSQVDQGATA